MYGLLKIYVADIEGSNAAERGVYIFLCMKILERKFEKSMIVKCNVSLRVCVRQAEGVIGLE